jgi:hypothetical protein
MVIYSTCFNIISNQFDYEKSISSFCRFADSVYIAVNKSKDKTYEELTKLTNSYSNLHLITTNIDYSNPLLDGFLKNESLKFAESNPKNKYFLGIDLDEIVIKNQREKWDRLAELFIDYYKYDGLLLPSVDLFGSKETVRWSENKNKSYKWYLHKRGLNRGPVNFAVKSNGRLDVNLSDGCEIVDSSGNLANCVRPDQYLDEIKDCQDYYKVIDKELVYVVHTGNLDFQKRIVRNNNFWVKQWKKCSGDENHTIDNSIEKFQEYKTEKHGLTLDI